MTKMSRYNIPGTGLNQTLAKIRKSPSDDIFTTGSKNDIITLIEDHTKYHQYELWYRMAEKYMHLYIIHDSDWYAYKRNVELVHGTDWTYDFRYTCHGLRIPYTPTYDQYDDTTWQTVLAFDSEDDIIKFSMRNFS